MQTDKTGQMLGLAKRAGKIAGGQFQAETALKSGKAALVVIAGDASENTRKHFSDMCAWRDVPCMVYGTLDSLGRCLGSDQRSVAAVTDPSFAEAILKLQ